MTTEQLKDDCRKRNGRLDHFLKRREIKNDRGDTTYRLTDEESELLLMEQYRIRQQWRFAQQQPVQTFDAWAEEGLAQLK